MTCPSASALKVAARPNGDAYVEYRATSTGNLCRRSSQRGLHSACGFLLVQIRSTPCVLRHASPSVVLPKKSLFDLRIDAMKPLLRAVGSFPIRGDFCFSLGNAIFSRAQFIRNKAAPQPWLLGYRGRLSLCSPGAVGLHARSADRAEKTRSQSNIIFEYF